MYVAGVILSLLAFLMSALGAAAIPWYLTTADGDRGILYAVGMILVMAALLPAATAGLLFLFMRKERPHARLLVRRPWLPACAPALVGLGLNLMTLVR